MKERKNNRNVCSAAANGLMVYRYMLLNILNLPPLCSPELLCLLRLIHSSPGLRVMCIHVYIRLYSTIISFQKKEIYEIFLLISLLSYVYIHSLESQYNIWRRRYLRDSLTTRSQSATMKLLLIPNILLWWWLWLLSSRFRIHTCVFIRIMKLRA